MTYDLAYGGNFYALVQLDALGLPFDRARKDDLLAAGLALMDAIDALPDRPVHPAQPETGGVKHVYLAAPGSDAHRSRHAMAIHPGWFDRSPCGTGTSARMAQLHARGELPLHRDFVNESFVGTRFTGRLVEEAEVGGVPAVVPPPHHRACLDHRHRPVLPRTRRPLPRGLPAVTAAEDAEHARAARDFTAPGGIRAPAPVHPRPSVRTT
ncbi:hypothetical protein GCM10010341_90050 [Streptomyces noursei]|nr:hypothetical protein GCM10010341_90050 [Streptomyces noursei]